MEQKKRIYCIEGVHNWGEGEVEPTVEPMLELLQRLGYWDYLHRTCGTMGELEYRLKTEWHECCAYGSVLYFNTHGGSDQIWLRDDEAAVGLITLKEWLTACDGCHIHFGGCNTFSKGTRNLKDLMDYTNASSVSGYATKCNWIDATAPALLLELQFFGLLKDVDLTCNDRSRGDDLRNINKVIEKRYPDCKFKTLVRRYKQSKQS